MRILPTDIPDVILIEPKVFTDERGFFLETFQVKKYAAAGVAAPLVQDNLSGSRGGVLRGLHYQIQSPQGKLVSALAGAVFDVAVDLRRSSPTFGKWVGAYLSAEDRRQMWVPAGFAHGFYVVSPWAEVSYKVTDYYNPEAERTLRWDDPALAIAWPLAAGAPPVLSAKDAAGRLLADADLFD
jgi:dTDP-4-dehydrorhamnose 3,5-epimerase